MGAFNTVDGVVTGYIQKFPETLKESDYWPLMRHALSWFNQANRVHAPARATVEIMLQSDRSADLPTDFVDWLVVGKRVGDKVENLCFNERTNRFAPDPSTPGSVPNVNELLKIGYDGYLYGELYGYGGGAYPANEFVVDKSLGKLYTNSEVSPGPLVLYYIYNPNRPNEATPIPEEYMMPLEYWMEWQRNRTSPAANMLKKQYFDEVKSVSMNESAGNIETYYNIFDNLAYGVI
jgi:hypothetical protein